MFPHPSTRRGRAPGRDAGGVRPTAGDPARAAGGGGAIRCPRCGWEPGRDDRWSCICGHAWNTFDTGGVCPACARRWRETQCLRCNGWSPHLDWYVSSGGQPPA